MFSLIKKVQHYLWPHYCVACRQITHNELAICNDCLKELPRNTQACFQCGLPLKKTLSDPLYCSECLKDPPVFQKAIIPFIYKPPIAKMITQLKFNKKLLFSHLLSTLFIKELEKNNRNSYPDYLIPLPLHKRRLRKRGFNQALEIARPISKKLQIPIRLDLCQRIKITEAQSTLPEKLRQKNIKNAFLCKNLKGIQHVAIIDDVMTTGCTAKELSKALKKAGCNYIEVWCCARAQLLQSKH